MSKEKFQKPEDYDSLQHLKLKSEISLMRLTALVTFGKISENLNVYKNCFMTYMRDPLIRLYMSFGSILVIFTEINKSNLINILFHKILEWDNNVFLLLNNISQNIHRAMLSIELLLYHSFRTANHYLLVYQASQLKSFQSCISCNCWHND